MFWYPYTGVIPVTLTWSGGMFLTGLAIAALLAAVRTLVLVLQAQRPAAVDTVSVPFEPLPLDEEGVVKHAAA